MATVTMLLIEGAQPNFFQSILKGSWFERIEAYQYNFCINENQWPQPRKQKVHSNMYSNLGSLPVIVFRP